MPAGRPDVVPGLANLGWPKAWPGRKGDIVWNQSVKDLRINVDLPVGIGVERARALAKSGTFLSALARLTAGSITQKLFKAIVGRISASLKIELPDKQETSVAAQQAKAQQAAQVQPVRLVTGRPAQVACYY